MTYGHKQVAAQVYRRGRKADVKVRTETGSNDFGNPTDSYTKDRTVIAFRTYPNRNTQLEKKIGDRNQDRPVFLVVDDEKNNPPSPEDRIIYNGTEYEVKAHTTYDTHVEFFGEPIIHG